MSIRDAILKALPDRLRLMMARDAAPPPAVVNQERDFGQPGPLPGPGAPIIYNQHYRTELSNGEEGEAIVQPRLFDYNYASNKIIVPRGEYGSLPSFYQLYAFYLNQDETRIASGWNINQLLSVKKDVAPRKGKKGRVTAQQWEAARRLLEYPDPLLDWSYEQWMRAVYQEKNVTDAVTIYPLKTFGGEVIAFQPIDGQTIKPLLSYQGGRPLPPLPAFVQYIKGYPFKAFDLNSIIYSPSRPRVWCAYGESRVEEVLTTMAALTLFTNWTNDFFTEGNIPEAALTLPAEYFKGDGAAVAKRVAQYQKALDAVAGPNPTRRRMHIPPVPVDKLVPLKEFEFDRELPEWYVRKLCVQFGCPPSLFVSETNRATAEQASLDIGDSVFQADLLWTKRLWDRLLAIAGFGDFELVLKPTRSFRMAEVEGYLALASTPLPVTPDNPKGLPAMSREELRKALGLESDEEADLIDAEEQNAPEPTAAPADAAAGAASGAAASPQPALPASAPPVTEPLPPGPQKAAEAPRPAQPPKVREYKDAAARSRLTSKFLGAIRPVLDERRRKTLEQGIRAARSRGKKVTGT